jgi:multidrug efflux pump subunit AcrA (membrane-fusion protein)
MTRRALLVAAAAAVALAALAGAVRVGTRQGTKVPTTKVRRGDLSIDVYTRGEFRATRSEMLVAPQAPGSLQIVSLTKTGARVLEREVVVEFDPAEQEFSLEQARSRLAEVEQEIRKGAGDAEVQAAQDKVGLLEARFALRRAELEVTRNELVSAIDARKNLLTLDEAQRRLAQLESDVGSRKASSAAAMAVLEARRRKARLDMEQARKLIDEMTLRAPIAGLVSIRENNDASGGFFFTGMTLPEYREGDLVWPGRVVAQVLDVDRMEVSAKLEESDRANVSPGQAAEVRPEALPGEALAGRVRSVAGLAASGRFGEGGSRKFDASVELAKADDRVRPGMSAEILIRGAEVKGRLLLPRQTVFDRDGKLTVYVRMGSGFEAREAKISHRNATHVAVEGLREGDQVALVDPDEQRGGSARDDVPTGPAVGRPGR